MKLIVLDRDGVINQDSDQFIKSPEEWKPIPGSLDAIARLNQAGYRVVVATNRDLQKMVAEKMFREDLYFRISAVPMTIPPLRERGNDVLLLAEHFLEQFKREFGKAGLELSAEAKDRLLHYRWPGNVRELQNTLERAVILADGLSVPANGSKVTLRAVRGTYRLERGELRGARVGARVLVTGELGHLDQLVGEPVRGVGFGPAALRFEREPVVAQERR